MLKLRIALDAAAGPWTWSGRRWTNGASWVEPYAHPAVQHVITGEDRPVLVVRERCPGADEVPHDDAWPGDWVSVEPAEDGLWLRAGAAGVAPVYLIARDGVLHGSWDVTDLRPYVTGAGLVLREAARLLGMRFRYGQETLFEGIYRLTERSRAFFGPSGLHLGHPLPAVHSSARQIADDVEILDVYEHLLDTAMNRHVYEPGSAAVELSGGLDSANVAATLGARHPGLVHASALLILGDAGQQQTLRRQQMIDLFQLGPSLTTNMSEHLPLHPDGRRGRGRPVTPYDDPYDEARTTLLDQLQQRGVRTVFTGVGGDELMSLTSAEQPNKEAFGIGLPRMPWIAEGVQDLLAESDRGIAPATVVNEMTLISQLSAGPPMMRAGMWPIHPLADPDVIRFAEWLPRAWREHKRLQKARLERLGGPAGLWHPALPENFALAMEAALRAHGLPYLHGMLTDGAILFEAGLIDPDGLAATVLRLEHGPFGPRDTELYAVVAAEIAARGFDCTSARHDVPLTGRV